jgi:uncharacterized protein (UPF0248 family)
VLGMGQEQRKAFIKYVNDDERVKAGFFRLISISDGLVTFETEQNVVSIPAHRVLKIKEEKMGGGYAEK